MSINGRRRRRKESSEEGRQYTASRGESAIDVEKAYCILDRAILERRIDACCFGMHCGWWKEKVFGTR